MTIHATGLALRPGDEYTAIVLSVDSVTGDSQGADYAFTTGLSSDGPYQISRDHDSRMAIPPSPTSKISYSTEGSDYTFTFSSAELGGTTAFNFFVGSGTSSGGSDSAPNGNAWYSYAVAAGGSPANDMFGMHSRSIRSRRRSAGPPSTRRKSRVSWIMQRMVVVRRCGTRGRRRSSEPRTCPRRGATSTPSLACMWSRRRPSHRWKSWLKMTRLGPGADGARHASPSSMARHTGSPSMGTAAIRATSR